MLIRSASPVAQYLAAEKLEVHFPLPGRSRATRPVRLVHHRDDPTSTANQVMPGDLLHFEPLKRSRNVVVSDVERGGFLGQIIQHIFRQLSRQMLRHVTMVVGVGTRLSALYRNAPASIRAGHVGGYIQI